ncbi:MAG: ABC transporter permease subunit [Phycisphaeraceae bacterium]|nr:MAG: ABC transporter permease subunit [Phycisphaeraceae bacterium]
MRSDGTAALDLITTIRPLGGGKPRTRVRAFDVPLTVLEGRGLPERVFVTGDGSHVLALWDDGLCRRYASRNPQDTPIRFAEEVRLLPEGRRVTAATMQLGGLTLLVGDDAGGLTTAFCAVDPSAWTPDGERLIVAWRTPVSDAAITAFGLGPIDRCLAVGDAKGRVAVVHTTSRKTVIAPTALLEDPIASLALTPKRDGIVAMASDGRYSFQDFEAGYPEASVHALFGSVHYEGAVGPRHVYQSSTGENTAEIKYGIMPLITGTLKATAMAMLIAVPLAVLAAIYTSEFLARDTRRLAKPAIEMMASLPSVVLGFLAAIVVAPYVADHLPTILLAFAVVPAGVLLAGFAWQAIPTAALRAVGGWVKVAAMLSVTVGGVLVSSLAAPWIERTLFVPDPSDRWVMGGSSEVVRPQDAPEWVGPRSTMSGDDRRRLRLESGLYFRDGEIHRPVVPVTAEARLAVETSPENIALKAGSLRGWLDGNFGSPWPGWVVVLIGPGVIISLVVYRRGFGRVIEDVAARSSRFAAAGIDLIGFAACLLGGVGLAWAGAWVLTSSGLDTRDLIFGPFSQRNTLVVGLLMGFAVVPIIYTIAEDAMSAVPASLRAASLGAGATPWQTALLIVLPVAGSGVFSAIMIGLGRAVGETMIVVMATGNTPSMDFNIFSGFRTLSANIAVEMPEAAHGDTHYRVLFLCGLVLFVLTFAVNTSAEVVRQRFRKRSASL